MIRVGQSRVVVNVAKSCIHAGQVRPSAEACGIDVYSTVRANGYPIEVVKDYSDDPNYYGLVLIK